MRFRSLVGLFVLALWCAPGAAQSSQQHLLSPAAPKVAQPAESPRKETTPVEPSPTKTESPATDEAAGANPKPSPQQFRVEVTPVGAGGELLTIFGRMDGLGSNGQPAPEIPIISVVRDTLSDTDPENDRLRYVWMLTYTRPNLGKRIASAIPFFYQHVGNQTEASSKSPKPILDLSNPTRQTWNRFFWMGMQTLFLDGYGIPLKASTRTYRRNATDYRSGHVLQALSILDSFEKLRARTRDNNDLLALAGDDPGKRTTVTDFTTPLIFDPKPAFTPAEMLELRARLILSSSAFGGLLGPDRFARTVAKRTMSSVDYAGHNWEMLRQRAEAEGLYFEPLSMPDGFATHAILWVSKSDLQSRESREFHDRFLNIANPWSDTRLRNWNGYTRVSYLDDDNRPTTATAPNARRIEMIPLAVYGLDHPKIPALLIDFRDSLNPKKREMSRRVLNDLAKNIFSLSNFGNLPYFAGKSFYDFVTGRRGMDINQPTRLRSYSELKLLLSFNSSLDPQLRGEIEKRVQNVSLNPLNNDNAAEVRLARQQYAALMDYARRPDGLAAKLERDRRAEMVPLRHGRPARFLYNFANVLTFGHYVHREEATPELYAELETARRIEHHTNFLKEVGKSSPQTDVAWDMTTVKRSLRFLADNGKGATGSAAKAAAAIFQRTDDSEARQLCLEALSKINNKTARAELLRIYQTQQPASELRTEVANRLRQAVADDVKIKPAEAKSLLSQVGTP